MVFLNIIIVFSPAENKNINGTTYKEISLLNQFKAFYYSIKKNIIKIPYRISVIHSIDYDEYTLNELQKLDIDIIKTKTDPFYENNSEFKWHCCFQRYNVETKIKGTHRLIAECDMLCVSEPRFNWDVDFQIMYSGNLEINYNNIIKLCNLSSTSDILNKIINTIDPEINILKNNKIKNNKIKKILNKNNYLSYIYKNKQKNELFPFINNGLILIKEDISHIFYNDLIQNDRIKNIIDYCNSNNRLKHFGIQLMMGIFLLNLNLNWEPFDKGINYLIKLHYKNNKNSIELDENINKQIIHYCGINADKIIINYFPEYFNFININNLNKINITPVCVEK